MMSGGTGNQIYELHYQVRNTASHTDWVGASTRWGYTIDNTSPTVGFVGATSGLRNWQEVDHHAAKHFFGHANDTIMTIDGSTDRVGIGTTSPTHKLHVDGSFAATTKSFVINHPSKKGKMLRHGSLEGPEHGVYVRGHTKGNIIDLPDYWLELVDEETITVQLTANQHPQNLFVKAIDADRVLIERENRGAIDCFYFIQAERKDVDKMEVEY